MRYANNEDAGDLGMMGAADASEFFDSDDDFECMECGARMGLEEAQDIVFGADRCECGGCDIDIGF